MKKSRVSMRDIAAELNISPATVHRALTEKANVNDHTRQIILKTAADMGYHFGTLPEINERKETRVALILRNAFPEQTERICSGVERACSELSDYRVSCDIIRLNPDSYVTELSSTLENIAESNYDGVIFYFANTKTQLSAEIRKKFKQHNTLMASLYSDDGFEKNDIEFMITPDAVTSGSMAADLMHLRGLGKGSKVAAFVGRRDFKCHLEYLEGFTKECVKQGIEIIDIIEHRDNSQIAYLAAEQFITDWPDIDGIYCATAITAPVCKAVEEANLQSRVCLIGTGLMGGTDDYLRKGILSSVLYYEPSELGYQAVKNMHNKLKGRTNVEKTILLKPQVVLNSNIGYFM